MSFLRKKLLSICIFTSISASALAAESVDLLVTGLIKPAACIPTLTGTADFGVIEPSILNSKTQTNIGFKELDMSIMCDGNAMFGIKATDNRSGTVPSGGAITAAGVQSDTQSSLKVLDGFPVAGLGEDTNGNYIGGYAIGILQAMLDSSSYDILISEDGNQTWSVSSSITESIYGENDVRTVSWGNSSPVSGKEFSAKLLVEAFVAPGDDLDFSDAVELNGSTTIEIVYL